MGQWVLVISGVWSERAPESLIQAAARKTPASPKETACPCVSGVSLGRGPEWWGIPNPGDAPTCPGHGPQQPTAAVSSLSLAVSPTHSRVGWLAWQRCPSVSTLQVSFQLWFTQGQGRTESGETPQCFWDSLLTSEQPATVPEMPAGAGQYNRVFLACALFHLPKALKSDFFPKLFLPSLL